MGGLVQRGGVSPTGGAAKIGQHRKYFLHGGRYASCVYAGGLSCNRFVDTKDNYLHFNACNGLFTLLGNPFLQRELMTVSSSSALILTIITHL